jgi:ribosome-binding factor A
VTGSQRVDRVSEELREVLAEEIHRLKDPRVGFLTITHVDVTPDLRKAIVYYTVMGEERDLKRTRAGLRSAAPHLRGILGHTVRLKFTPELEFREDVGQENVDRVAALLQSLGPAQVADEAAEATGRSDEEEDDRGY